MHHRARSELQQPDLVDGFQPLETCQPYSQIGSSSKPIRMDIIIETNKKVSCIVGFKDIC